MSAPLRVAVVGARGIGKHHAKWFARAGCAVSAIYGTTADSAARAAAGLRELFPFAGEVYSDWGCFLADGSFDAASVCTPAEAHRGNVLDLVAAGKHVLCEKPVYWDWEAEPAAILAAGEEMVSAARAAGVVLAINAQYPAGIPLYRDFYHSLRGRDPAFDRLAFRMETKGQPRSPHGPAEVWVDLAPHPIAVLDAVLPGAEVRWQTLRHESAGLEAVVSFTWSRGDVDIEVQMTVRRVPGGTPTRWVSNGDLECTVEGRNVEGEFVTVMRAEGQEWTGPDFMRTSIERFIDAARAGDEARALVTGEAGVRQLRALVGVWERCWR